MLDLALLWVSQIAVVWGLVDGAGLSDWAVPCLAASMTIALRWGASPPRGALLECVAWLLLGFNLFVTVWWRSEDWSKMQPALASVPLLVARDIGP